MVRRSGRRPGNRDTRAEILETARQLFAQGGYDQTSIRTIAAEAGVDPALVHHYFGTKEKLFLAVVSPPVDPSQVFPQLFVGDLDGLGERLARTFVDVWEGPTSGGAFRSLLRSGVAHEWTAALIREFFTTQVVRRVRKALAGQIPADEIPLRANLVASQLFGVALTRYLLRFEPLASATPEQVVAAVGPTLQRYLTGEVEGL